MRLERVECKSHGQCKDISPLVGSGAKTHNLPGIVIVTASHHCCIEKST